MFDMERAAVISPAQSQKNTEVWPASGKQNRHSYIYDGSWHQTFLTFERDYHRVLT